MAYITGEGIYREMKLQNELNQAKQDIDTLIKHIDKLEEENETLLRELTNAKKPYYLSDSREG
jgi:septation ring formation regulator EzrA